MRYKRRPQNRFSLFLSRPLFGVVNKLGKKPGKYAAVIERVSIRVSDGNGPAVASIGCDPFLPFGSKNITSPVAKTKNHRHRCAIC